MDKPQQLEQIARDIRDNDICPGLRQEATQLVPGTGNADADTVFIGEAPGRKEDEQGEPFVGAAGKFLDEMLESIGSDRNEVFITNIVKYRPPNNRDPLPEEKSAFWPYLLRQLEVIQPKLIVTLGRHSMEYFLPGKRISQIHGQPKRLRVKRDMGHAAWGMENGAGADAAMRQERPRPGELGSPTGGRGAWVVLPLYHPAAALYNGGQRQTLLDDFASIPAILRKLDAAQSATKDTAK